jgi:peptidylprolyl isomerase
VKTTRVPASIAFAAFAATFVVTLAACGSNGATSSSGSSPAATPGSPSLSTSSPSVAQTATDASTCPTAAPDSSAAPEWTLAGTTGSVAVTGSTDIAAPQVKVTTPFSVAETQVHTLVAGDGPIVAPTATVSVCYVGVNGRDGTVFDSSYQRGAPEEFPLDGVVAGFQKAIAGQKVGSTVAVAMDAADGYPEGQPAAGIQKGDTLIFALKILSVSS